MRKRLASFVLVVAMAVAALGAQDLGQMALAAQAAQAAGQAGTAPVVAPAIPAVTNPIAPPQASATTIPVKPEAVSGIERMFGRMAEVWGSDGKNLGQFGYSMFETPQTLSLASVGDDYVLGPGDSLILYLWGDPVDIRELSASYTLTVDRNGAVFFPPTGQIPVWGQDLATLRATLQAQLSRRYKKIDLNLTLASLRQFPVFVSGYAEKPGTVLATGADTLISVLARSGGVMKSGTLRAVSLSRQEKGGRTTTEIDFYDALVGGKQVDLRVREGDSIHIPGIGPTVALTGEVKRPGIYETKGATGLDAAIALAGGSLPSAAAGAVSVLQASESGYQIRTGNLADKAFTSGTVKDGELILLGRASELLVGNVALSGPVKYPGRYEAAAHRSLRALLLKAQILPETSLFYARVYRMDESGKDRSFTFSPREVLGGADIVLKELDRVELLRYDAAPDVSQADLERFPDTLIVEGAVRYPGLYRHSAGLTLSALMKDNAFVQASNLGYAELTRSLLDGRKEYLTFRPRDLAAGTWDTPLAPRDRITFRPAGYAPDKPDFDRFSQAVLLQGPARHPGLHAFGSGLRLSGLIAAAMPLLETNQYYAEIVRPLPGGRNQYLTFAPREVAAGLFDLDLQARDTIRLFTTAPVVQAKLGAEATQADAQATQAAVPAAVGTATAAPTANQVAPAVPAQAPQSPTTAPAPTTAPGEPGYDLSNFLEVVTISGTVRYAGPYARSPSLKLSQIIVPDQVLETTNLEYAELTRLKADGSQEFLTFAPRDVLEGSYDLAMRARDAIRLVAKTEFGGTLASPNLDKFAQVVQLAGQVARPERFALRQGMKLSQVLTRDQVLLDTNLNYAEVTRLKADGKNEYLTFRPAELLSGTWDLELGPRDLVRLVKVTYTATVPDLNRFTDAVLLAGPAEFPGLYAWREGMKLSSLIALARIHLDANQYYAEIVRPLPGGRNQYLTFALREVAAGIFDLDLQARDTIRLFTTAPVAQAKLGGEVPQAETPAAPAVAGTTAAAPAVAVAPIQAPAGSAQASATPATPATQGAPAGQGYDLANFLEVVTVSGTVRYTGPYARTARLKLSTLVTADQILATTNLDYAELVRRNRDGSYGYYSFAPRDVLAGTHDMALEAQDALRFVPAGYGPDTPDFDRFPRAVLVRGPVLNPGLRAWRDGMKLSGIMVPDFLNLEANHRYAELVRTDDFGRVSYLTFDPTLLMDGKFDLALKPRDIVRFVARDRIGSAASAGEVRASLGATQAVARQKETIETAAEATKVEGQAATETAAIPSATATAPAAAPQAAAVQNAQAVGVAASRAAAGTIKASASGGVTHDFDRFPDTVTVAGAVLDPDRVAWRQDLTLGSVLTRERILITTNRFYGEIERRRENARVNYLSFSPERVARGLDDLDLEPRDIVRLFPVDFVPDTADFDRFPDALFITGPVKYVGFVHISEAETLSRVVRPELLLSVTDPQYAELDRRRMGGRTESMTFSPKAVIEGAFDLKLQARDEIRFLPIGTNAATHDFGKYPDTVVVQGKVRYPGRYAWRDGMTLADIVRESDLLMDASGEYGEVRRHDGRNEAIFSFRPSDSLSREPDLSLRPRDIVKFYPKYNTPPVTVSGNVEEAKILPWYAGMDLLQVLRTVIISGDDALQYKAVITAPDGTSRKAYLQDVLKLKNAEQVLLKPGDAVSIQELLPDENLPLVTIKGAVRNPQALPWGTGMRLSDALKLSGGYAVGAFPEGLVLVRKSASDAQKRQIERLISQLESSTAAGLSLNAAAATTAEGSVTITNIQLDQAAQRSRLGDLKQIAREGYGRITLDMPATLEGLKGSGADIVLERDDAIWVPETPSFVVVSGEVADQTLVSYRPEMTVGDAISQAGWTSLDADTGRSYILRASGRLVSANASTGSGSGGAKGAKILSERLLPGDTVVVPRLVTRPSLGWATAKDLVTIVASLITAVVSILVLFR